MSSAMTFLIFTKCLCDSVCVCILNFFCMCVHLLDKRFILLHCKVFQVELSRTCLHFIADYISILVYIMGVILCLFSTLSCRGGTFQSSIIIIVIIMLHFTVYQDHTSQYRCITHSLCEKSLILVQQ